MLLSVTVATVLLMALLASGLRMSEDPDDVGTIDPGKYDWSGPGVQTAFDDFEDSDGDAGGDAGDDVEDGADEDSGTDDVEDEPSDEADEEEEEDDSADEAVDSAKDTGEEAKEERDDWLTDDFAAHAAEYGVGREVLQSFQSREQAEMLLAGVHQRFGGQPQPKGADKKDNAQEVRGDPSANPRSHKLNIKELLPADEVNEHIVGLGGALQEAHEAHEGRFDNIEQVLDMVYGAVDKLYAAENQRTVDSFVGSLGEEWSDLLGDGPTSSLSPTSMAYKNRDKVIRNAMSIVQMRSSQGEAVSLADMLGPALHMTFSDKAQTIARKAVASKVRRRKGQSINRPTHRGKRKLPRGRERASEFLSNFKPKGK